MKIFWLFLCAILFFSLPVAAQKIQFQKTVFVPKEMGTFHVNEVVATNTRTGKSLIVWERVIGQEHTILGRIINSQGKPSTAQFLIVAGPNAVRPAVVFNPVKNEFLLAYDDNPGLTLVHSDTYLLRLNAQGRPLSSATKASNDTISTAMANVFPKVVFNPKNSTYVLLWLREAINSTQLAEGNNGLVGVTVNETGGLSGPVTLIQKTLQTGNALYQPIPLDAVFHPANSKLMLAYVQVIGSSGGRQVDYTLGTLSPTLANISPDNFKKINSTPVSIVSQFSSGVRIAFPTTTGVGFLIFVDSGNIKRRKIDAAGKLSGAAATAFRQPKNNTKLFFPAIAFSNGASGLRGLLVAVEGPFSENGAAKLWAQSIDSNGVALGSPVKVETTSSTDTALNLYLLSLPQPATASTHKFAGIYTLAGFGPPNQTFNSSGLNLLNLVLSFP